MQLFIVFYSCDRAADVIADENYVRGIDRRTNQGLLS
jgi:hypothetical protein